MAGAAVLSCWCCRAGAIMLMAVELVQRCRCAGADAMVLGLSCWCSRAGAIVLMTVVLVQRCRCAGAGAMVLVLSC